MILFGSTRTVSDIGMKLILLWERTIGSIWSSLYVGFVTIFSVDQRDELMTRPAMKRMQISPDGSSFSTHGGDIDVDSMSERTSQNNNVIGVQRDLNY
jgi:hypothetical protein